MNTGATVLRGNGQLYMADTFLFPVGYSVQIDGEQDAPRTAYIWRSDGGDFLDLLCRKVRLEMDGGRLLEFWIGSYQGHAEACRFV